MRPVGRCRTDPTKTAGSARSGPRDPHSWLRWVVVVAITVAGFTGVSTRASGQSKDELRREIDELKAEREAFQEEILEQAGLVDTATAEVAEVEQALADLELLVAGQRDDLAQAERALESAEAAVDAAERRASFLLSAQDTLSEQANELAVQTYLGRDSGMEGSYGLARTGDIYEAARIQTLVGAAFGDIADTSDEIRALQVDTEEATRDLEDAADLREEMRVLAEDELEQLLDAVALQDRVVAAAEERLETRLYEAAALEDLDAQMAAEIRETESRLAAIIAEERRRAEEEARRRREAERRRLEEEAARRRANGTAPAPTTNQVPSSQLHSVYGITIHESIADNLQAMIEAAAADGIQLRGGGYRSPGSQIALRRAHCGSSDYAIYEMPSTRCRPPTARPGQSMHERGLAVDFTQNGRTLRRDSSGYRWLVNNAGRYGFRNLPSEPWHWSTNGR